MTWRTKHFRLEELLVTSTGLPNAPTPEAAEKLYYLAQYLLEPLRARYGVIEVTSGYRSPAVNAAVGGVANSQHARGEAADVVPIQADLNIVYRWIVEQSGLVYGQCILELDPADQVIHLSLPRPHTANRQPLVLRGGIYAPYTGPEQIGLVPRLPRD